MHYVHAGEFAQSLGQYIRADTGQPGEQIGETFWAQE